MESRPLNLAHKEHRRAEAHLKYCRFDEAIQCHHNAAELLLEAMKTTTSSGALESITLQHSYHLKQKDFIKTKKEQHIRVKKAMENMKNLSSDSIYYQMQTDDIRKLQITIFKRLSDSGHLLNVMKSKFDEFKKLTLDDVNHDEADSKNKEKSQRSVFDEMQNTNHNLTLSVEQLMMHVEVLKDDNSILKERVKYLEKERTKYLNIKSHDDSVERNDFSALSFLSDGSVKDLNSKDSTLQKPFNINDNP